MSLPFKQTPNPLTSNEKPTDPLHVLQVLCAWPRLLWAQFHSGERDVGLVLGKVVHPLTLQLVVIVLDLVSPLAATPSVGTKLPPSSPKDFITSFTWRKSHPKSSRTPSHLSVGDLEMRVKIRCLSDHLRLVPLFELGISHSASPAKPCQWHHHHGRENCSLLVAWRCNRDDELDSFQSCRCAEQIGPGSSVVFLREPARSHERTLGSFLVRVRPASLDGVLPPLLPALAHRDLFIHRVLLYVLHLHLTRLPNQGWIQPSSTGIVQVLSPSDRIQLLHNRSTFTPPTASLQYLGRKSKGLTRHVHHGSFLANVEDLGIQVLSKFGSFHPIGNMWAVREEAHSFSITSLYSFTKRVEDVLSALQQYHAREKGAAMRRHWDRARTKLISLSSHVARLYRTVCTFLLRWQTPSASCGSATIFRPNPLDRQGSFHCLSDEKQGCHPSHSARSRPPRVASFIRSAPPKTSASCASCPISKQILRHLFVSSTCQWSSVLLHQRFKLWIHVPSTCYLTWVHPESRGERT